MLKKGVTNNPIVVSRFDELPIPILEIISVMVKALETSQELPLNGKTINSLNM